MAPDERAVRAVERCTTHPSRPTVAACEVCSRALCVECAVPVRGRVLGPECLSGILGHDPPAPAPPPWRRRPIRSPVERVVSALLAAVVVTTLFPWTRFSSGSGFAGAWAIDARWSMVAAVGSVLSLASWLALRRRPGAARTASIVGGVTVAAGSLLAILNPPPFTKPAFAPWLALASGLATVLAGALARARPAP